MTACENGRASMVERMAAKGPNSQNVNCNPAAITHPHPVQHLPPRQPLSLKLSLSLTLYLSQRLMLIPLDTCFMLLPLLSLCSLISTSPITQRAVDAIDCTYSASW